jgi:hypothetical protein
MESYQEYLWPNYTYHRWWTKVSWKDDPECVVDEECTYDIVLVCDNVFIAKELKFQVSIENKIYDSRIETMHGFLEL